MTRRWVQSAGIVLGAVVLCFVLLAALHAGLDGAGVRGFDVGVQAWLHQWSNRWVRAAMLALSGVGAIKIFAVALGLVVVRMLWQGHRHGAALLGFGIGGAFLLNEVLKNYFRRPRPPVAWALGDEHTYSFPSGHSLFSVVLYGALSWLALRHGASVWRRFWVLVPALLLPFGIGVSRIYLGEHWPTDVIAGWTCGAVWLGAISWLDVLWGIDRGSLKDEVKRRLFADQAGDQPAGVRA